MIFFWSKSVNQRAKNDYEGEFYFSKGTLSMKLECFTIMLIVAMLVLDFVRRGRKEYALCTAPLLILPFTHLAADLLSIYLLYKIASPDALRYVVVSADVAAALFTALLLFLCKKFLTHKKSRVYYTVCCIGYTFIVAAILILFTLSV